MSVAKAAWTAQTRELEDGPFVGILCDVVGQRHGGAPDHEQVSLQPTRAEAAPQRRQGALDRAPVETVTGHQTRSSIDSGRKMPRRRNAGGDSRMATAS